MKTYRLDDIGGYPSAMGRRCSFTTATGTTWRGVLCGHWETHKSDPGKHGVRLRLSGGSYRTVEHLAGDIEITIYPKEAKGANGLLLKRVRDICAICPVRQDCLDAALAGGISHGIWGGTTGKQRRSMPGWVTSRPAVEGEAA